MFYLKNNKKVEIPIKLFFSRAEPTVGSCVIHNIEKISNLYTKLTITPKTIGIIILALYDNDGNFIDEIAIKSVIAPPEEQFIFMKG